MRLLGYSPAQQIAIPNTFECKLRTTVHPYDTAECCLRSDLDSGVVDTCIPISTLPDQVDSLVQIFLRTRPHLILSLQVSHKNFGITQVGMAIVWDAAILVIVFPLLFHKFADYQTIVCGMLVRSFRIAAQNHFASSHLVDFIGVRAGVIFISQHNVVRIFLGECAIFLRGLIFSIIFRILRLIRLNGHCQSGITVGKRVFRIIERRFVDRQSVYAGISA